MNGSDTLKLVQLRLKTDRQLVALMNHQLETGMRLMLQSANGNFAEAERAWSQAGALLPLVHTALPERRKLEFQFQLLGSMLQKYPTAELPAHATCSQIPA